MEKSLHSEGYALFLGQLRAARKRAGVTQVELAERLSETQSFVSKCERGERRLDMAEAWQFCRAIGVPFTAFAGELDTALSRKQHPRKQGDAQAKGRRARGERTGGR